MYLMAKVLRLSNRQLNELHSLAIKIADTKQMVLAIFYYAVVFIMNYPQSIFCRNRLKVHITNFGYFLPQIRL